MTCVTAGLTVMPWSTSHTEVYSQIKSVRVNHSDLYASGFSLLFLCMRACVAVCTICLSAVGLKRNMGCFSSYCWCEDQLCAVCLSV